MMQSNETKRPRIACMHTEVCAITDTAPHVRRISLKHEALKEVGPLTPGAHFKVFISPAGAGLTVLPDLSTGRTVWTDEKTKPFVRTYTVRSIDYSTGILDVEFVLHGDGGPASAWAGNVSVGDQLAIGIKTSGKTFEPSDWYFFAGDETATPAITAMLEALPARTTGLALLEADTEADTYAIKTDSDIKICWILRNGIAPEQSDLLLKAVKSIVIPELAPNSRYFWIAGEERMVRSMRKYASEHLGLSREELHAKVYWSAGLSEDDAG